MAMHNWRRRLKFNRSRILAIVCLAVPGMLCAQDESKDSAYHIFRLEMREMNVPVENVRVNGQTYTRYTGTQQHYQIQFQAEERFKFVVPQEFLDPQSFFMKAKGFTVHTHGVDQELPVSNLLLHYREALLAAAKYFDDAAASAGLTQRFVKDEPVTVLISNLSGGTLAFAQFGRHRIVIRPDQVHAPAVIVHEYFHFVQKAVWIKSLEHFRNVGRNRVHPFYTFLSEMTATWAMDEPIQVAASPGMFAMNIDYSQCYLRAFDSDFVINQGEYPLLATSRSREYQAGLLIKFWAEQAAGQRDESASVQLLKALSRTPEAGGFTREGFFQLLTKGLPPQFNAPTDELRWQSFFRSFCAANVVQNAALRIDRADPIGYHDEAFKDANYLNQVRRTWDGHSSALPTRVEAQVAANDMERKARLRTLCRETTRIGPLAAVLHLIDVKTPLAPGRPIYVYSYGDTGSDCFVLRHKQLSGDAASRANSVFYSAKAAEAAEAVPAGEAPSNEREHLFVTTSIDNRDVGAGDYLWVGLVNGATDLVDKERKWAYLMPPRLIPDHASVGPNPSGTVWPVGGVDALDHESGLPIMASGDAFHFRIQTSGPLHREGADLNDLRRDAVSLDLTAQGEAGEQIKLREGAEGLSYRVRATPHPTYPDCWNYYVLGHLADDQPYFGPCHFRFRISSPLNLGEQDEQIDETYRFLLSPHAPCLERLVIQQADQTIYDSLRSEHVPAQQAEGAYLMQIRATFTRRMDSMHTRITSGFMEPFDRYPVEDLTWTDGKNCTGSLRIPAGDVPEAGGLLRIAVSGATSDAPRDHVDGDILKPGPQPDTSHFTILGPEVYWEVAQSCLCRHTIESFRDNVAVTGVYGPVRAATRVVLSANQGLEAEPVAAMLTKLEETIGMARTSINELRSDLERAKEADKAFFREALQRQRQRLELMTKRLRPMLEAMWRLESGYRRTQWEPLSCGPISLRLQSGQTHWTEITGTKYPREFGRTLGDPVFVRDARQAGLVTASHLEGPVVWSFQPSDLRKVQQLMNLAVNPPGYVTRPEALGSRGAKSDSLRVGVWFQLAHYFFPNDALQSLGELGWGLETSRRMWEFYPASQWPVDFEDPSIDHFKNRAWTQLPPATSGGLVSVPYGMLTPPCELPVSYEKLVRHWVEHGSDESEEKIVQDDAKAFVKVWPARRGVDHLLRIERNETTDRWRGTGTPWPSMSSAFDHPSHLRMDGIDKPRWRTVGRHRAAFMTYRNEQLSKVFIYGEPDHASATLLGASGIIRTNQNNQIDESIRLEWETSWELQRMGSPLPADANPALPEWDKSLGDPPSLSGAPQIVADRSAIVASEASAASEASDPSEASAASEASAPVRDPVTGQSVESRENPDGTRTVTVRHADGTVGSQRTVGDPRQLGDVVRTVNPDTGETTTVTKTGDGMRTVTIRAVDGTVNFQQSDVDAKLRLPSASIQDPSSGSVTTSERMPDGSVRITRRDRGGKMIDEVILKPRPPIASSD